MEDIAQVKIGPSWQVIDIAEALGTYHGRLMRCHECHGQVFPHKAYSDGARAHFEHKHAHLGCSTKPTFKPPKARHPKAIG